MCRIDYEATVKAANEAQHSAQLAQNNAADAAAKASLSTVHDISSYHGSSGSSGHGSSGHGGYQEYGLDAHGSQKTLTVAASNAPAPHNSGEKSPRDAISRSSNVSSKNLPPPSSSSSSASSSSASSQASSKEIIASNHNYGGSGSNEFKPSAQYSFAGY